MTSVMVCGGNREIDRQNAKRSSQNEDLASLDQLIKNWDHSNTK